MVSAVSRSRMLMMSGTSAHFTIQTRDQVLVLEFHFHPLAAAEGVDDGAAHGESVASLALEIDDLAVEQHAGLVELSRRLQRLKQCFEGIASGFASDTNASADGERIGDRAS